MSGRYLDPKTVLGFATEIERAYAAGFFDADGHARVSHNKGKNGKMYSTFLISIGQKDPTILKWYSEHFGGNIYEYNPKKNKKTTVFHMWSIAGTRAYIFYLQLRPYIRGKAKQIDDAALGWYNASPKPHLKDYQI